MAAVLICVSLQAVVTDSLAHAPSTSTCHLTRAPASQTVRPVSSGVGQTMTSVFLFCGGAMARQTVVTRQTNQTTAVSDVIRIFGHMI